MTAAELARVMPDVARHFWGEPNPHHSNGKELRWGTNGARSVDLAKGVWHDHAANEGGGVIDFLKREGVRDPWEWLRENRFAEHRDNGAGARPKIVATYDYTDEHENVLFQVVRLDPKTFRQRRPDGNGGWIWNLKGVARVLYRLPDLLEALALERRVFIVEGEKDVETLRRQGITATCNAGGAEKWRAEFAELLVGANVVILPDNDAPGHKHADDVARSLTGKAARIRVVKLPGLAEKGDVSDWFAAGGTVKALNDLIDAPSDWTASATQPPDQQTNDKPLELVPINLAQYDTEEIPAREWGVENRFPRRTVVLLSGHGGAGKSLLLLQLSAAHVLQKDWLRSLPVEGPVLLVNCEDDEPELVRRLEPILKHYGVGYADVARDLHAFSLVDRDDATGQLLATVGRDGIVRPTALYGALMEQAHKVKPICIVIDNVADVFGGNEIDRSQVRQFVRLMRRLAIAADGYVIMSAHPSLQGISSKSGLSGSTQWHNSVRARAYLRGPSDKENGEAPASDVRVLEFMKSNYSALAEQITLRWANGLYLPAPTPSAPETAAANNAADTLFLELLDQHTHLGDNVSPKSRSNNYAPTVFAKTREARAAGIGKDAFAAALARLIEAGRVRLEPYGPPSDDTKRLARLHASSTHPPRTLSTAPPYTPHACVEGGHARSGGMGDGVEFRVVSPAPGATCVCCKSADGAVMKFRPAVPGSKTEPLHAECAARWFSGGLA